MRTEDPRLSPHRSSGASSGRKADARLLGVGSPVVEREIAQLAQRLQDQQHALARLQGIVAAAAQPGSDGSQFDGITTPPRASRRQSPKASHSGRRSPVSGSRCVHGDALSLPADPSPQTAPRRRSPRSARGPATARTSPGRPVADRPLWDPSPSASPPRRRVQQQQQRRQRSVQRQGTPPSRGVRKAADLVRPPWNSHVFVDAASPSNVYDERTVTYEWPRMEPIDILTCKPLPTWEGDWGRCLRREAEERTRGGVQSPRRRRPSAHRDPGDAEAAELQMMRSDNERLRHRCRELERLLSGAPITPPRTPAPQRPAPLSPSNAFQRRKTYAEETRRRSPPSGRRRSPRSGERPRWNYG